MKMFSSEAKTLSETSFKWKEEYKKHNNVFEHL